MQELDLLGRHVGDILNAARESIVGLQICDLLRKVVLNRLLHASIEELGVRGRVEIPVVVGGVVRSLVEHRGLSRAAPDLCLHRLLFMRRIGAEAVRHRAPSSVADEDAVSRLGRVVVFRCDQSECADGFDVREGFFPEAAFGDMVGCCYPEVAGDGFFLFGFESANDRCGGRSSLRGKVHSRVTVSHGLFAFQAVTAAA